MYNKNMKRAFIIHGAYGNPEENWIPWLKEELTKLNYEVVAPTFPTPEKQSLENWFEVFSKCMNALDNETIMVGHSLGVPFILNVLQKIDFPIRAMYLVSGFHTALNLPLDEINKTFIERGFDWEKIKSNCLNIHMFNGANDKYIPTAVSDDLAKKLGAKYELIPNGGHLNAAEKALWRPGSSLSKSATLTVSVSIS